MYIYIYCICMYIYIYYNPCTDLCGAYIDVLQLCFDLLAAKFADQMPCMV